MAHYSHIIVPSPRGRFWGEEQEEKAGPPKVWKRPWLNQEKPRGRVYTVINLPVDTGKEIKKFAPFQVALMAFDEAKSKSFDVIRVITPGSEGKIGDQAHADVRYAVKELEERFGSGPSMGITPPAVGGTIHIDDQDQMLKPGTQRMPRKFKISETGILHPVV